MFRISRIFKLNIDITVSNYWLGLLMTLFKKAGFEQRSVLNPALHLLPFDCNKCSNCL